DEVDSVTVDSSVTCKVIQAAGGMHSMDPTFAIKLVKECQHKKPVIFEEVIGLLHLGVVACNGAHN
ncbi:hypothetical protein FRX31_016338, partial [Thalictrum thalictroides]